MENSQIDTQLLEFLQTLPPEVRDLLLQDFVNQRSRLVNEPEGNRPAVFTPGKNGSYVIPRTGPMEEPTLLRALDNQRRKRAKSIIHPDIDALMGY